MRLQFSLPADDYEHLSARGLQWETVIEAGQQWLLLPDFPIPSGYKVQSATVALMISPAYPAAEIDMVWFYPTLVRKDNVPIGALCDQIIDGRNFQRWSRHRTVDAPWRPGLDSVATHLSLVEEWLKREFHIRKGA